VNGQIQYGSAQSLTAGATRRSAARTRHSPVGQLTRPVTLLVLAMIAVVALLVAFPRQAPGTLAVTLLGGVWLMVVLAVTLPSGAERAHAELATRVARFRHAVNAIGDAPTRLQLTAVLDLARELNVSEQDVTDDFERVRASLAALTLAEEIAAGHIPVVPMTGAMTPGAVGHFQAPVRLGRRRSDQLGELMMTPDQLTFRGPTELTVAWTQVANVQRAGADLIVTLADRDRSLRFSCDSVDHAARGGVIAEHLQRSASGAAT
jgi:hypothetical protein